jgi:DNA-directed RNA polymerase subunit beta'
MLDAIKSLGYKYSTQGAITVSIADMSVPEKKYDLIHEAEKEVVKLDRQYRRGMITNDERYRLVVAQWEKTTDEVTGALQDNLDRFNPIFMMADSGARGSMAQIRQLAGMRGLMANTAGRTIEIPVKANFREGLSVLEYFISSRGARKGLTDTALRTADSGYLTRRMVDVSQDVIIRQKDCGTTRGRLMFEIREKNQVLSGFAERIRGRYLTSPVVDADTGEVLIDTGVMLDEDHAEMLNKRRWKQAGEYDYDGNEITFDPAEQAMASTDLRKLRVRSMLFCRARSGVCATCYGMNLATSGEVNLGEAVGIIAAQSIGEPGTQLTMRTFHTGGVAGDDITQGLPRVEELFEARKPKKMAQLAEISGRVEIDDTHVTALRGITITNEEDGEVKQYQVPYSVGLRIENGQHVAKGTQLVDGSLSPHDILRISGEAAVQDYLIQEVLKVYRQQGVDINEKHIEVIVRQMMRKVRVEDCGDSKLLDGTVVDVFEFEDANAEVEARIAAGELNEDGNPLRLATRSLMLMGITKASLATDSFLSAASFQETTKVLTEAAIKGKVDHLVGLKENVIIGKLLPAGTGMTVYRDFQEGVSPESEVTQDMIDNEDF